MVTVAACRISLYKAFALRSSNNYCLRDGANFYRHHYLQRCCNRVLSTPSSSLDNNDARSFLKSYELQGTGGKSRMDASTSTGHRLSTDVPMKMGGKDSSPQPVEMLLAAWMGCTQVTAIFVGRQVVLSPSSKQRINIEKIEFDNIQAYRDERGALELPIHEAPSVPSRLQRITGTVRVFAKKDAVLTNAQIDLLKEQTEIRCPVANMIMASGCSMEVEWIDGNSKD